MGKTSDTIVDYSGNDSDNDSLQLIDPVTRLSLEHVDKPKLYSDRDDHSRNLTRFHSNDLTRRQQDTIKKRNHWKHRDRHHPYDYSNRQIQKQENVSQKPSDTDYDMKYLKSLGYIEYSSTKESSEVAMFHDLDPVRTLFIQVNNAIQEIFSKYKKCNTYSKPHRYICNRRFQ